MYVAIREEVAHDKITAFEKCIAVRPFLFFPTFSFESNYIWGLFVKFAACVVVKNDFNNRDDTKVNKCLLHLSSSL